MGRPRSFTALRRRTKRICSSISITYTSNRGFIFPGVLRVGGHYARHFRRLFKSAVEGRYPRGANSNFDGNTRDFLLLFHRSRIGGETAALGFQIAVATDSTTAIAVLLVASHGLYAACIAMLLQRIAMMPAPLIMLRRATGISPLTVIWAQLPILTAAAIMALIVVWFTPLVERVTSHSLLMPVLILIGAFTYLPLVMIAAPDIVRGTYRRLVELISPGLEPV